MTNGQVFEYDEIQQAQSVVDERAEKWLRKRGWNATSQTPTCCWYWTHEWDGKVIMVSLAIAIEIQAAWDYQTGVSQ